MGRPLFSQSARERAVRVVDATATAAAAAGAAPYPTAAYPYAKWSLENDFDPDSAEFERDAVYEAFLPDTEDAAGFSGVRITGAGVVIGGGGGEREGGDVGRSMREGGLSDPELSSEDSDTSESGRATPMPPYEGLTTQIFDHNHPAYGPRTTATHPPPQPRRAPVQALVVDPHLSRRAPVPELETPVSPEAAGRLYVAGDMVTQFGALYDMIMAPGGAAATSNRSNTNAVPGGISRTRDMASPAQSVDPLLASPQSPEDIATRSINRQALFQAVSRVAEQFSAARPEGQAAAAAGNQSTADVDMDLSPAPGPIAASPPPHSHFLGSAWPTPIPIPARPSTPPNPENSLPSPGVTPRTIYTWPHTASIGSPLPNPTARMSLAHIAPPSSSPMHVTL